MNGTGIAWHVLDGEEKAGKWLRDWARIPMLSPNLMESIARGPTQRRPRLTYVQTCRPAYDITSIHSDHWRAGDVAILLKHLN